jgi:putative ABC transport system permease protein
MALLGDIRFALRTMAGNRTTTIVAIVALSLGMGANATVFSIVNGALFKNLPFVGDDILYLATRDLAHGQRGGGVSFLDFLDWREHAKSFRTMGAFRSRSVNLSEKGGAPSRYIRAEITADTFSTIGQKPLIGRDFTPEDEKPGAPAVVILGNQIWVTRYGANRAILGRIIRVNDVPSTVIGVMRPDFRFPEDADVWVPLIRSAEDTQRQNRSLGVYVQLAPSVTKASADAEMQGIARNLEAAYPATNHGITAVVQTFYEVNYGDSGDDDIPTLLAALMGSVIFVLLIACANVANLLLARAADRSREISIRVAIGAGRWHIIRQLLVESVILSLIAGFFGWLISLWGLKLFDASVRAQIPAWMNFSMDYRGFVYLAAISVGAGLLFGLAPALRLARMDVNASLREGGRGSSGGAHKRRLSGLLVIAEMALAVVLLAGAGLMIRSFLTIYSTSTGVNPKNVLVMRLMLPEAKYPKPDDKIAFHDRLKAKLDALPGVVGSTIAITMPTGGSMSFPYELEHAQPVDEKLRPSISLLVIGPDYFRVMELPVLQGRAFANSDSASAPPVAIVNQRFTEKFWRGEDPVGKRLRIFNDGKPEPWLTVVGVVPNVLQNGIAVKEFDPLVYVPYRQRTMPDMALMARTRVPPASLAGAFRQAAQAVDEDMPLYNLRTLEERLAINYWEQGIFGSLFSIFAVIALLLASVGLYAVIAQSVSQRTQEIGLRMALGASARNILRMVFRQGLLQLAIGLLVGMAGAVALTRFLSSLLVLVSPTDPATFALVAMVLGLAATLGCLIPARRATRVDPLVALRHE